MTAVTEQMEKWMAQFGKEYTDRNAQTLYDMDNMYVTDYGISRTELNELFLGEFDRNIRILEVGSNVGSQLLWLQKMGFKNLYGIEINSYAIEYSKAKTRNINIIQGSAFDIPFKDDYFDIVFTSGVLIHISPADIKKVIAEIDRCSREYIWGFEYYADKYTEVKYGGHDNLLWKGNFVAMYLDLSGNLKLVKEKKVKYLNNDNVDAMFLIRKQSKDF